MWGKLNKMVAGDQEKIQSLEEALEMEQQRNKIAQDQFRKLLKEKERQIQKLQAQGGGAEGAASSNGATDVCILSFYVRSSLIRYFLWNSVSCLTLNKELNKRNTF